jgi:hypothetical protein
MLVNNIQSALSTHPRTIWEDPGLIELNDNKYGLVRISKAVLNIESLRLTKPGGSLTINFQPQQIGIRIWDSQTCVSAFIPIRGQALKETLGVYFSAHPECQIETTGRFGIKSMWETIRAYDWQELLKLPIIKDAVEAWLG